MKERPTLLQIIKKQRDISAVLMVYLMPFQLKELSNSIVLNMWHSATTSPGNYTVLLYTSHEKSETVQNKINLTYNIA